MKSRQAGKRCVEVLADAGALSERAASIVVRAAADAIRDRSSLYLALAGGSTPRGLYRLLASDPRYRHAVDWSRVEFFWGDERHVPPTHPDSNYRMAADALLDHVPVSPDHVHRIQAELGDANAVAAAYEEEVRRVIPAASTMPVLDLVLLGIGADGHTASLFPSTAALEERERLVVATHAGATPSSRITMTLPLINAARHVLFLVTGGDKAEAVRRVLDADPTVPAALVQPGAGELTWLVDLEAAGNLTAR